MRSAGCESEEQEVSEVERLRSSGVQEWKSSRLGIGRLGQKKRFNAEGTEGGAQRTRRRRETREARREEREARREKSSRQW
jgi:hypothetical protein